MTEERKSILIFINHYLPGYKLGGPIRSVGALVQKLKMHFDFNILTLDRDLGDKRPFSNIELDKWLRIDGCRIKYVTPAYLRFLSWIRLIRNETKCYDTAYLCSFFNFRFSILIVVLTKLKLIDVSLIISPRGEFNLGALNIRSNKKRIYINISKFLGLYSNVLWHATSEDEKQSIIAIFGDKSNIRLAPNLIFADPSNGDRPLKKIGEVKLVFLARISEMKNPNFLLKCISGLDFQKDEKLILHIYGPIEDNDLYNECMSLAASINSRVGFEVSYKGAIAYEDVSTVLDQYHFYVLPTRGENFGQGIFDSLMAGCPVIISNKTPWRDLQSREIGWDLELDLDSWKSCILNCMNIDDPGYQLMSGKAKEFAILQSLDQNILEKNIRLFNVQ